MKNKSTRIFFALPLILSLSACASPQAVVRVEPLSEPDSWKYGQAVQKAETDGIVAEASFAYADREYLVFNVAITNWREDRILVDPAPFTLSIASGNLVIPAIDPEGHLLGMDLQASRQEANAKNAWLIAGVATAAAVAATAAVVDNNNDATNGAANIETNDIILAPTVFYDGAGRNTPIQVGRRFWSDETLRKTTLEKGQQAHGLVVFLREKQLSKFTLSVPVEKLTFSFGFLQKLYWP